MRLRTLGAVCATSALAVPITAVVPFASAQEAPPVSPAPAPLPGATPVTPPGDMHRAAVARLSNRHLYFARRYHRLLGDPLSRSERQAMRVHLTQLSPPKLRAKTRDLRGDIRRLRRHLEPHVAMPPQLKAIAMCESHGNPRAISAGGQYRGKYQFDFSTWRSVGGKGDPARASETEQDRRAAKLYRTGGPAHWPVCGR
jgi:hypothetical protein